MTDEQKPTVPAGLPLTADERAEINRKIEALEKRKILSEEDVAKIVQGVLDAREAKRKEEAPGAPKEDGEGW